MARLLVVFAVVVGLALLVILRFGGSADDDRLPRQVGARPVTTGADQEVAVDRPTPQRRPDESRSEDRTRRLGFRLQPLGELAPFLPLVLDCDFDQGAPTTGVEADWRAPFSIELPAGCERIGLRSRSEGWRLFPPDDRRLPDATGRLELLVAEIDEGVQILPFGLAQRIAGRLVDGLSGAPAVDRELTLSAGLGFGLLSRFPVERKLGAVTVIAAPRPDRPWGPTAYVLRTDAEGAFEFPPVPPGACSLSITGEPGFFERDHRPSSPFDGFMGQADPLLWPRGFEFDQRKRIWRLEARPGVDLGRLELPVLAAPALRGRLLDHQGRAVAAARILYAQTASVGVSPALEVVTDEDGRFIIDHLPQGSWCFRAWTRSGASGLLARLEVEPDDRPEELILHLDAPAALVIEALDELDRPVPGVEFRLLRVSGELQWENGSEFFRASTGNDGRLRAELPPGPIRVELASAGRSGGFNNRRDFDRQAELPATNGHLPVPGEVVTRRLDLEPGAAEHLVYRLRKAALVRARVVDSARRPRGNWLAKIEGGAMARTVAVGSDGGLAFLTLEEGPFRIGELRRAQERIDFSADRTPPLWPGDAEQEVVLPDDR